MNITWLGDETQFPIRSPSEKEDTGNWPHSLEINDRCLSQRSCPAVFYSICNNVLSNLQSQN